VTPHDEFAERSVLGMVLAAEQVPTDIGELMRPDDVWTPSLRSVAEACWDLTDRKKPCDPVSVRTELLRRGVRGEPASGPWLLDLMNGRTTAQAAAHHARTLRDLSVRRSLIEQTTRAAQQASNPSSDPYDLAAAVHAQTAVLAERADPRAKPSVTDVHDFLEGQDAYDWLVPGLLERGDRVLLTAAEGAGKSVLVRQFAVSIAAGAHPFSGSPFDPKPVLLIDLENGTRHLRRALQPLVARAASLGRPIPRDGLRVESRPSGIDLTRLEDEQWLTALCETVQPELLVVGPLYRMHATDMAKEEPARHLTRVLDGIRARHSCALVVETHAPHTGQGSGTRNLRPIGSSLFMRWPEFGYGISPSTELEDVFDLKTWRGPRDERAWPSQIRWGRDGEWPWVPVRQWQGRQAS
jgi:hypothetical protein